MSKARRLFVPALSLVLMLALGACGLTSTQPTVVTLSAAESSQTSAYDSPDDSKQAEALNQSGVLGTKDISDYEAAVGQKATTLNTAQAGKASDSFFGGSGATGFTQVKHVVKIGYVRSQNDGQYEIALNNDATKIALTGSDGKRDSRIAGYLNHKVILYGILMANGQLMVEHILGIPSFHFITDLFFKGRLAGNVFLATNNQGLVGALVEVKAGKTGYIFRTQSDSHGNFGFSGLDPDTYSLTVGLGGFKGATQSGIVILKGKKTSLNFAMTPNGN